MPIVRTLAARAPGGRPVGRASHAAGPGRARAAAAPDRAGPPPTLGAP